MHLKVQDMANPKSKRALNSISNELNYRSAEISMPSSNLPIQQF